MPPEPVPFDAESDLRRAKITGAKVFASDFHVKDVPKELDWPNECAHALLVRAAWIDRPFVNVDTNRLTPENRPARVITAKCLAERGMSNTAGLSNGMMHLCPQGQCPQYLSQPLAILLFNDFLTFRRAAQELREDRSIVQYGTRKDDDPDKSTQQLLDDWRKLREPKDTEIKQIQHYLLSGHPPSSQFEHGTLSRKAGRFERKSAPDPTAEAIYDELLKMAPGDLVVETTTFTQQIDPAFLEPESGLAAVKDGKLAILTGTQSPFSDHANVVKALDARPDNPGIQSVQIIGVDSGGGFGGRDKAPLMFQLAFAAAFSDVPVRLAYDRFEQFQAGMKRHASGVHSMVSARPDGSLDRALVHFVFEGGAEPNLGNSVMQLGALHATGFYRFQQASVHGLVTRRRVPIVGSMRGFGIPQVSFNIETALDKLAVLKLKRDPIEVRRQNVLRHHPDPAQADRDVAGTPLRFHVANAEVCEHAARHRLWRDRDELRRKAADKGLYAGVGFAGCMEAYGTTTDSVFTAVQLELDGGVTVFSETADMGQGARRSLGKVASDLFRTPAKVALGRNEPFVRPELTGAHGAASASKTAFFHVHVLRAVSEGFIRFRILPAVRALLGRDIGDDALMACWRDGAFHVPGSEVVPLAAVAVRLEAAGQRFAIAHGFFANGWSRATFVDSGTSYQAFIDALGFARDVNAEITLVPTDGPPKPPQSTSPGDGTRIPRSGYAAGGHLIAVEIDPQSGGLRVTDAVAFVDAGDAIMPTILEGQIEGGFQMGVAHALFEELPPESGFDRFVNFDRYILPRASDIAGINLETVLLPLPPEGALNADDAPIRHKGVGEVTMTTVAPAIANAIAHALGHHGESAWPTAQPIRFKDLDIRSEPGA